MLFLAMTTLASPVSVAEKCYAYLTAHEVSGVSNSTWAKGVPYHFYRPGLTKYGPQQWLWDSGAHMTVWSHRNVTNAVLDLRTMLSMQRDDGRVPEMLFWAPGDRASALQYSMPCCADLTQMPVLPFALRAIANATAHQQGAAAAASLLQEFMPKVLRYFRWWRDTRTIDADGLVAVLHGWESGLDASPAYDEAYGLNASRLLNSTADFLLLYPKFDELVLSYKARYRWNQSAILTRPSAPKHELGDSWFIVKDVGVNAVLAAGWGVLAELADAANLPAAEAAEARAAAAALEAAIVGKMWEPDLGRFVTLYRDRAGVERRASAEVVQGLLPLLLPRLPADVLGRLLDSLLDPAKFWRPFPVPSTSADAAAYNPYFTDSIDLMWRGPTWGMTNWLVMEGLSRHAADPTHGARSGAASEELLDRWLALVEKSGVFEMYNPETGAPYGVEGLGMSTLIVDWLVRFGRVNATAAPFAPAQTHYARPPCLPDEDPWSTETSAGTVRWCAKYCPDGARCPTDVPAGVTARPSCGLVSGKPYCMLDCGVDGECDVAGGGACLVSGPGSGVCVYKQ
jgi:hypothetical protein